MRKLVPPVFGIFLGFGFGILVVLGINRMGLTFRVRPSSAGTETHPKLEVGAPAPDFELFAISGEQIHLQDLGPRVILINFWATWCGPCRLEMPVFQSRSQKFPDALVVLAINAQDKPEDIFTFMDELDLTFNALLDPDGVVHRRYLVRGFPSSFFIDPEGILRFQHIGLMTEEQLDGYLFELGLDQE